MELDARALWMVSYGMYVISARAGERANAQIANTVFQITAEPPRFAVSINKDNLTHALIRAGGFFGISVLGDAAPPDLIGLLGFKSGREVDKLAEVSHRQGLHCPLVTDHAIAVLEVKVEQELDAGTHTLFAGEVIAAEVLGAGAPLTYAAYHARKGRAPKNAPTYQPEPVHPPVVAAPAVPGAATYTCGICSYRYDPHDGDSSADIPPGTRFEDLPDDWVCPICGAGKSEFLAD